MNLGNFLNFDVFNNMIPGFLELLISIVLIVLILGSAFVANQRLFSDGEYEQEKIMLKVSMWVAGAMIVMSIIAYATMGQYSFTRRSVMSLSLLGWLFILLKVAWYFCQLFLLIHLPKQWSKVTNVNLIQPYFIVLSVWILSLVVFSGFAQIGIWAGFFQFVFWACFLTTLVLFVFIAFSSQKGSSQQINAQLSARYLGQRITSIGLLAVVALSTIIVVLCSFRVYGDMTQGGMSNVSGSLMILYMVSAVDLTVASFLALIMLPFYFTKNILQFFKESMSVWAIMSFLLMIGMMFLLNFHFGVARFFLSVSGLGGALFMGSILIKNAIHQEASQRITRIVLYIAILGIVISMLPSGLNIINPIIAWMVIPVIFVLVFLSMVIHSNSLENESVES